MLNLYFQITNDIDSMKDNRFVIESFKFQHSRIVWSTVFQQLMDAVSRLQIRIVNSSCN